MEQDRSGSANRGLGPRGTSLKAKLGQASGLVFSDPFAMQLEQQERKEQRVAATLRWASRNRTPPKPLAPVRECEHRSPEGKRLWIWEGEDIRSKDLFRTCLYSAETIRAAGFKLPTLVKTKTQRKPRKKREGESDG